MTSNKSRIISGVIAAITWAMLALDVVTPRHWFDVPTASGRLLVGVATVSALSFALGMYRRPMYELYLLGIAHGRREMFEEMNTADVIEFPTAAPMRRNADN